MCAEIQNQNQNPGVAPPDCALLFYWPKRVSRKGPTLRWACLVRQGGNINSGSSDRPSGCTSPAGTEALESLSFCGELQRSSLLSGFSLIGHTVREAPCNGPAYYAPKVLDVSENRQRRCPPQGDKAFFAYFLSPPGQKVRRLAGRDPPVFLLRI